MRFAVVGFGAAFIVAGAGIGAVATVAATSTVTIATAVTAADDTLSNASVGNRPNHEGYRAKHGRDRGRRLGIPREKHDTGGIRN